jgi:hypothetical protein
MTLEKLFALLMQVALIETPVLEDGQDKHVKYIAGMREMAGYYIEVGKAGEIVSPDADPLLLAVIGYGESRHQPKVKDGDCVGAGEKPVCAAVGPMQLHKGNGRVLANIDPEWKGTKEKDLRDPKTSVRAAYRLLRYYKETCPEGGPAGWLSAWAAGRCFHRAIPIGSGRCVMARALGKAAGVEVAGCESAKTTNHKFLRIEKSLSETPKKEGAK